MTIETWLIVTVVLCVIEAITVGLTTIWFAAGALAAALVSWLGGGLWLQLFIFLVLSIILLILTRPLVVKYLNGKTVKTNADRLIGQQCLVEEEIYNLKETGQIKINGLTWTARSVDPEQVIPKGETVVIEAIEGVKAMVRMA